MTLWQAVARISRNGSLDAIHSAPVEELQSAEETEGTLVHTNRLGQKKEEKSTLICLNWSGIEVK